MSDRERTLTDADVAAIAAQLKSELVKDFYGEVGRGVWSWIKKALIGMLLLLTIYFMANKGGSPVLLEQAPK